jgi:hypothetical protein
VLKIHKRCQTACIFTSHIYIQDLQLNWYWWGTCMVSKASRCRLMEISINTLFVDFSRRTVTARLGTRTPPRHVSSAQSYSACHEKKRTPSRSPTVISNAQTPCTYAAHLYELTTLSVHKYGVAPDRSELITRHRYHSRTPLPSPCMPPY